MDELLGDRRARLRSALARSPRDAAAERAEQHADDRGHDREEGGKLPSETFAWCRDRVRDEYAVP